MRDYSSLPYYSSPSIDAWLVSELRRQCDMRGVTLEIADEQLLDAMHAIRSAWYQAYARDINPVDTLVSFISDSRENGRLGGRPRKEESSE